MSYDISFCSNEECPRKDCRRHLCNTPGVGLYSMSDFGIKDTDNCEWYWEGPVKEGAKK